VKLLIPCEVSYPQVENDADRAMLSQVGSGGPEELAIACWKGKNSVNLLVSKVETDHLLEKFGMELSKGGSGGGGAGMEVN
jgi:hypothetical protein